MTSNDDVSERLRAWLGEQLPTATDVRVEGLDKVEFGHSAEILLLTVAWTTDGSEHREDVVLRMRPPKPGLIEPYDMQRQFDILRALESTPVRSPRALWIEPTGEVLGREFVVMERRDGEVYERELGADLETYDGRLGRMCESFLQQVVAMHSVDLDATGLTFLGDGQDFLARELDHWTNEMNRVKRGPLPALERVAAELKAQTPQQSARVTLVHGDAKPGNFGFIDDEVNAVYDWEMADVGDPLCDLGYIELLWNMPVGINSGPSSPTVDELAARYEELSGIPVHDRAWYRAFQTFKISIIQLVGAMLLDAGYSDDPRFAMMAEGTLLMTPMALADLGVEEEIDPGPVRPREERLIEVLGQAFWTE
jgi:aminoglycoside phosphotransferase (APT) family kinase protein